MTAPRRRAAALIVAVASLLLLGLRPTRRAAVTPSDVVLATPGADPATARRLADSAGAAVVRIPEDVADGAALARGRAELRTVIVTGWGLERDDAAALAGVTVLPRPAALPAGVVYVSFPTTLTLGSRLVIEGATHGIPAGALLRLSGPGGSADSARLGEDGRFRLSDVPRAAGRQVYRVEGIGSAESLGVWVAPPASPRALLLQAAPGFEHRVLRDWLAERGGAVAVRTAVSRDRWRTEFVNRAPLPLVPLREPELAEFDVVITDRRALDGLAPLERRALERAVTERGVGLIVSGDSLPGFASAAVPELGERRVRPDLPGHEPPRTAIPAEPAVLRERYAVATLIRDGSGAAIAQVTPRGAGWVALSLASATSPLWRSGERDAYAAFWSRVLTAVARAPVAWRVRDEPHLVHHALRVTGPGAGNVVLVKTPDGTLDSVFVAVDPLEPRQAHGTYWPRAAGWHTLAPDQADSMSLFVGDATAWAGVAAAARVTATALAATRARPGGVESGPRREQGRPIPRVWVFVLFVAAAGYLWSATRR